MEKTMSVIQRTGSYSSIDILNHTQLVDGEELIIKWPDGQMQQVMILVEKSEFTFSEQGSVNSKGISSHAYVISYHRGVQIKIPLLGLEAQRVIKI